MTDSITEQRHDNNASSQSIKIFSSNICSLRNKIDLLSTEVSKSNHLPDVIAIQESRLGPEIPDSEVQFDNFKILRNDRVLDAGGVAFLFNSNQPQTSLANLNIAKFLIMLLNQLF